MRKPVGIRVLYRGKDKGTTMTNLKNFLYRITHKEYKPHRVILFIIFLILVNVSIDSLVAFLFVILWLGNEFYQAWKERGYRN